MYQEREKKKTRQIKELEVKKASDFSTVTGKTRIKWN